MGQPLRDDNISPLSLKASLFLAGRELGEDLGLLLLDAAAVGARAFPDQNFTG